MNSPIGLMFHGVYDAMEGDETDEDYLANLAMAALQTTKNISCPEARKNSASSEFYREEGNIAYKNGQLQKALVNYNKAMAYAPNGSICLKLAYSNRSAVLFTAKEYKTCQKDCIKALAMDCPTPTTLTEKLEKRISQAQNELKKSVIAFQTDKIFFRNFADDFFKLKSRNSGVPSASADVDFVVESGIPKVIAKRTIAAGTLVGLEKAFVTWAPNDIDQYFSCHYCRKLSLNLFPCGGCVVAMFCSEQCEENCMAEYHIDECKIAGFINGISPSKTWVVKAMFKLLNMCSSWDELISMSYDYGYNRRRDGTANDIYNGENPSSILSFYKDRKFLSGALFNSAITCANYVNLLQNLESFMPQEWEKKLSATKAMARIMMYLTLSATTTLLPLVTNATTIESILVHKHAHWGLFPFVGKLKHSCMPNLQTQALNNTIALVALEQIKAGTELTISHVLHWLDNQQKNSERRVHMFINHKTICTCLVCTTNPEDRQKKTELTAAQKRAVQECVTLDSCRAFGISIEQCFAQIYKALACLHKAAFPLTRSWAKRCLAVHELSNHYARNLRSASMETARAERGRAERIL